MKSETSEPPSHPSIDILNRSGSDVDTEPLERAALLALNEHRLCGELCVVLTDDQEVRSLNREHRGLDEPTDVLTFPSTESASLAGCLGDVVIAVPFAAGQAERRSVSLPVELAYLSIHGALHIAGLEDEDDDSRLAMQREMARVAALAGLPVDPDWVSIGCLSPAETAG